MSYIYGFQCGEFIKIGRAGNIAARLRGLQLGNPQPIKVVLRRRHDRAAAVERLMHKVLREQAVGREWFRITAADARLVASYAIATINTRLQLRPRDPGKNRVKSLRGTAIELYLLR